MTEAAAIEIRELSLRMSGRPLFEGFSLRLARGERVTLTGPSGCGKSSILRSLLGFVLPSAGELSVEGQTLSAANVWALRRRLAYVPQESDPGDGTVEQFLGRLFSYRANSHLRAEESQTRALFERFLLPWELRHSALGDLSGGEKQRVAILCAVLLERPIFLLDEASSALDPDARAAVLDYFRERRDATILSISHDPDGFDLGGRAVLLGDRGGTGEVAP